MKAQQEAGLSSRDNLSGLSVRSWAMQDIASGEAENFTAMQLEEQSWTLRLDASTDEESIIYIHNLRPIHTFRFHVPCHASEVKFISKRIKHLLFINLLSPLEGLNCSRPALPRYSNGSPSASG